MKALFGFGYKIFRGWWWLTRPLTLGVNAVVLNERREVLLVKHTYQRGWYFPGGGVKKGESTEAAIRRELKEEVQLIVNPSAEKLVGIYYQRLFYKNDHQVVYLIKEWRRDQSLKLSFEIETSGFFPLDALPEGTSGNVRARLEVVKRLL